MRLGDLFYMNRHDRRILLVLLTVAAVALGGFFLADDYDDSEFADDSGIALSPASSHSDPNGHDLAHQMSHSPDSAQEDTLPRLFPFDPNTADSMQLRRLGLTAWQVRNIRKYRAAGGIYRTKESFARLYGLTAKKYKELEPYIRISPDYQPAALLFPEEQPIVRDTLRFPLKIKDDETVDINANDTAVYKKVPGIGTYFSRQIADYGRRLGGYISIDQLDEIYGFPKESKRFFSLPPTNIHKMNINSLSVNELRQHPYINYYQARAIVDYRRQHGPLKSLKELSLLPDFPDEAIRRLEPYVCYE